MKKTIFALIAATFAMSAAHAEGPYVGLGVSTADHNLNITGATSVSTTGYKASGKIFGGIELDKNFGVEAGYTDFAKATGNYTLGTTAGKVNTDGHAFYVAGKFSQALNDQISLYAKLGIADVKTNVSGSLNYSDSKTSAYGGLGAQYALNKNVALNVEYERYGSKTAIGAKPDVWTAAIKYSF